MTSFFRIDFIFCQFDAPRLASQSAALAFERFDFMMDLRRHIRATQKSCDKIEFSQWKIISFAATKKRRLIYETISESEARTVGHRDSTLITHVSLPFWATFFFRNWEMCIRPHGKIDRNRNMYV